MTRSWRCYTSILRFTCIVFHIYLSLTAYIYVLCHNEVTNHIYWICISASRASPREIIWHKIGQRKTACQTGRYYSIMLKLSFLEVLIILSNITWHNVSISLDWSIQSMEEMPREYPIHKGYYDFNRLSPKYYIQRLQSVLIQVRNLS